MRCTLALLLAASLCGPAYADSIPSPIILPSAPPCLTSGTSYPTPAGATWLELEGIAGGQGGGGSGTGTNANGAPGGNTTFGPITVIGGANSGTSTLGTVGGYFIPVTLGQAGTQTGGSATFGLGGTGGGSIFGGGGQGAQSNTGTPTAGSANTGAGGGGAGTASTTGATAGTGGTSGVGFRAIILNPASTYTYSIGAGGTGGAGSTNGATGATGAAGQICIKVHFGS